MLAIGKHGNTILRLTPEQRSRHLHVMGASGTGKSKFLELMIIQDILAGRGVCVIDPHGSLADHIVEFCASRKVDRYRRIHIIEPSDGAWCTGFNPLRTDDATDLDLRVDTMVDACAEVWGGENIDDAPLLATCLQLVFHALATHKLTLVEAVALTRAMDPTGFRKELTEGLSDEVYQAYWEDYRNLPRKEFEERFSSTRRRLLRFLGKPIIRRIVGQRERVLNLRQVMDEGDILIVNLAQKGVLSPSTARLLGALLTSDFYLTALGRPENLARRKPYYLYIDECYDYLTGDIERILDQTRKFGLHLVLAHHRLAQLRKRSEAIYSGVMTGAQTKIVFGGLTDEDAEIMVKEMMRDTFDLERPKHSLDKMGVVGYERVWLESMSTSEGTSDGWTVSNSNSWNELVTSSETKSESFELDRFGAGTQTGYQSATNSGGGYSTGGSSTEGRNFAKSFTSSRGYSEALKPILEEQITAVHSLDEEVHLAIVKIREQPNQRAIVKTRGKQAMGVQIPHVSRSLVRNTTVGEFRETTRAASSFLLPRAQVDTEISLRHVALGMKPRDMVPVEEQEFWYEDVPTP